MHIHKITICRVFSFRGVFWGDILHKSNYDSKEAETENRNFVSVLSRKEFLEIFGSQTSTKKKKIFMLLKTI